MLERARLTRLTPANIVAATNNTAELKRLAKNNGSIWAEKELLLYIKNMQLIFGMLLKVALLADPSVYQGEETCLGILWSWEKQQGAIGVAQVTYRMPKQTETPSASLYVGSQRPAIESLRLNSNIQAKAQKSP